MINEISEEEDIVSKIIRKLKHGKGLHDKLPGKTLVHIDRPLPFICIYRYPEGIDKSAHARLIDSQPSFILVQKEDEEMVKELLIGLSEILRKRFGAMMLLEVWAASDVRKSAPQNAEFLFELFCSQKECKVSIETLEKEICEIPVVQRMHNGTTRLHHANFPSDRQMLIDKETAEHHGVQYIGLEVEPFYYDQSRNSLYPMLFRAFRNEFSIALKKAFFDFVRLQTRYKAAHFHVLGRQTEGDIVWKIDQELVDINNSFDFLLLVTVTNHEEEWEKFVKGNYNHTPNFQYRLINVDPELLKRRLYNIPIEDVDDPTLAFLFRDKREELDRMLSMLIERDTPHFKYSSIQVFGSVGKELHKTACQLLEKYPPGKISKEQQKEEIISAETFAELAQQELKYLKGQYPQLEATIQIREDIEGLMVSQGHLMIGHTFSTTKSRAEALIQHEVGTHVLTYFNGQAQPLKQLYLGSPGYEDLQEGLAVLAEYLVGSLTPARLRILAARVVAIESMLAGADFIQTFRLLHQKYNFTAKSAFSLTTRVYRGGGLTKDAVYLKGLIDLLNYLSKGKPLEPLLIGKIRQDYLPFIDELKRRQILVKPPLRPRYFSSLESMEKLKRLKRGATIFDLIE